MTNPRTGYPDGYLIYLIEQIDSGIRRPFEELLASRGITMACYTALTVLQYRPGITSSELARRSFVRAQTMAETVKWLATNGLVRREQAHGRQLALFITEQGLDRVQGLAAEVTLLELQMISGLDDGEPETLVRLLRTWRDALAAMSRDSRSAPA